MSLLQPLKFKILKMVCFKIHVDPIYEKSAIWADRRDTVLGMSSLVKPRVVPAHREDRGVQPPPQYTGRAEAARQRERGGEVEG